MLGRPLDRSTARIWALESGGLDQPGVIWCGTLPGGLFRSTDHGQSWEMMRALWDHPKRKQWSAGGADLPGLHSICIDPRSSQRVWVAVSTGGIWFTEDGGASWTQRGNGMRAEYVPPEMAHDPVAQDVHRLSNVRQHHSACGYNIITVSSSPPMKAGHSRRSRASNPRASVLPLSFIRASPTRHGLFLRSRMRSVPHRRASLS